MYGFVWALAIGLFIRGRTTFGENNASTLRRSSAYTVDHKTGEKQTDNDFDARVLSEISSRSRAYADMGIQWHVARTNSGRQKR
jgi:hypothetical protein